MLGGAEAEGWLKAAPARESHASSRGEGGESHAWRAEGRGTIPKSLEGGMTTCLLSPSLSRSPNPHGCGWKKGLAHPWAAKPPHKKNLFIGTQPHAHLGSKAKQHWIAKVMNGVQRHAGLGLEMKLGER